MSYLHSTVRKKIMDILFVMHVLKQAIVHTGLKHLNIKWRHHNRLSSVYIVLNVSPQSTTKMENFQKLEYQNIPEARRDLMNTFKHAE